MTVLIDNQYRKSYKHASLTVLLCEKWRRMPKKLLSIKLDEHVLAIVGKYQRDHSCDRTKAISQIIRDHPLLLAKLETKKLAGHLTETMNKSPPEFSIMPEICKHITEFRTDRGGEVMCALRDHYVTDVECQTCAKREPVKETDP